MPLRKVGIFASTNIIRNQFNPPQDLNSSNFSPFKLHELAYVRNIDPSDSDIKRDLNKIKISVADGKGNEESSNYESKTCCSCSCNEKVQPSTSTQHVTEAEQGIGEGILQSEKEKVQEVEGKVHDEVDSGKDGKVEPNEENETSSDDDWVSPKPVKISEEQLNNMLKKNNVSEVDRKRKNNKNLEKYNYKKMFLLN